MQRVTQRDEYECRPDQTGQAGFLPVGRCGLHLQKQVNALENEVHRMKRVEARRRWRYGRKKY